MGRPPKVKIRGLPKAPAAGIQLSFQQDNLAIPVLGSLLHVDAQLVRVKFDRLVWSRALGVFWMLLSIDPSHVGNAHRGVGDPTLFLSGEARRQPGFAVLNSFFFCGAAIRFALWLDLGHARIRSRDRSGRRVFGTIQGGS